MGFWKVRLTKKKFIGLAIIILVINGLVNIVPTLGLAQCEWSVMYFEFKGNDGQYAHLSVLLFAHNPTWIPIKIPKIYFEIKDPEKGEYAGKGEFGPIDIPPGGDAIVPVKINLANNDAGARLIRYIATYRRFDGKIRVHYPITFFGLFPITYAVIEIDASKFVPQSQIESYSQIMIPTPNVDKVILARETDEYADALVKVSGVLPPLYSRVGEIKFHEMSFDLLVPQHLFHIEAKPFSIKNGKYNATFVFRIYKRGGLADFIKKYVETGEIEGKVIGRISLTIFGIYVPDIEIIGDINEYASTLSLDTMIKGGGVYSTVGDILSSAIEKMDITYDGYYTENNTEIHVFKVNAIIRNSYNWTYGFGNMDLSLVRHNQTIIRITSKGRVILEKNKPASAHITVYFYKSQELYEFLRKYLYENVLDANLSGTLDVYLLGLWFEQLNTSSPLAQQFGTGSLQSFTGFMPTSTIETLGGISAENVTIQNYNIKQLPDRNRIRIKANVTYIYPQYPLRISDVNLNILYNGTVVGEIRIPEINLENPNPVRNISLTIDLFTNSKTISDFLYAYVSGENLDQITLTGTFDLDFLGYHFSAVPIKLEGSSLVSFNYSEVVSYDMLSNLVYAYDVKYIGSGTESGIQYHELLVKWTFVNIFDSEIAINELNVNTYVNIDGQLKRFGKVYINTPMIAPPREKVNGSAVIRLYSTPALREFIKDALAGNTTIFIDGIIDLSIGGIQINDVNVKSNFVFSLLDSIETYLNASGGAPGVVQYAPVSVNIISEKEDRVVLFVIATTNLTFPVTIYNMTINILSENKQKLVTIQLARELSGYGSVNGCFIIILYNSTEDFEEFISAMAYGEQFIGLVQIYLDIEIFGVRIPNIQLELEMPLSAGDVQTQVISFLKVTELFRITRIGQAEKITYFVDNQAYDAYMFPVSVEIFNPWNLTIRFSNMTFNIYKDDQLVLIGRIEGLHTLEINTTMQLNVTIILLKHEKTREFLQELIGERKVNITTKGSINIWIFGIELKNVTFERVFLIDLSQEVGVTSYADIQSIANWNVQNIDIIGETDEYGIIDIETQVQSYITDITIYNMTVYVYLPKDTTRYVNTPIAMLTLRNIAKLSPDAPANVSTRFLIFKNASEDLRKFIREVLSYGIVDVEINGTILVNIFEFNLTIPLKRDKLTYSMSSEDLESIGAGFTATGITENAKLIYFEHVRDVYLNGILAHELKLNYSVYNVYNTRITVKGRFYLLSHNEEAIIGEINNLVLEPKSWVNSSITLWLLHKNVTRDILDELFKRKILNCSVRSEINITVFGIELPINITLPIMLDFSQQVSGMGTTGEEAFPLQFVKMRLINVNILGENETYVSVAPLVEISGIPLNITIHEMNVNIMVNNTTVMKFLNDKPLSISKYGCNISVLVFFVKGVPELQELIQSMLEKNYTIVNVSGIVSIELFGWEFTIPFELYNVNYSSEEAVGPMVPIGFDKIVKLSYVRQVGDRTIEVCVQIKNIFNTTIGIGNTSFYVSYLGEQIIVGDITNYYLITPDNSTEICIFLTFLNKPETQKFLEYMLSNIELPNISIAGSALITLFGVNISVDLSKYSLSTIPTKEGISQYYSQINEILPQITYDVVQIEEFTDRAEISVNVTVINPNLSVSIYNLSFEVRYQDQTMFYVNVEKSQISLDQNSSLLVKVIFSKAGNEGKYALQDFIEKILSGETVNISILGYANISFLGFNLNFTINMTYIVNITDLGRGTTMPVLAYQDLINVMEIKELEPIIIDATVAHPILVSLNITNPFGLNVTVGNLTLNVFYRNAEVVRVVINDSITIAGYSSTLLNITMYVFEKEETHKFIEEILINKTLNVTFDGSFDVAFLGIVLDNISLAKFAFYDFAEGISDMSVYENMWYDFASYTIGETSILKANEIDNIPTIIAKARFGDVPIYLTIYEIDMNISIVYGQALSLYVKGFNETCAVIGPGVMDHLNVTIKVYKQNTDALEYLFTKFMSTGEICINATIHARIKLFKNSSDLMLFDITFNILNYNVVMPKDNISVQIPSFENLVMLTWIRERGTTYMDDQLTHIIDIAVEVNNPYGIGITIGNVTIDVLRNDTKTIVIEIPKSYEIPANSTATINATIYIVENAETRELFEEILKNGTITATVRSTLDVVVFGVHITNITLGIITLQQFAANISSITMQEEQFAQIAGYTVTMLNIISAEQLTNKTYVLAQTEISNVPIYATIYSLSINVSTPYGLVTSLNVSGNTSQEFYVGPFISTGLNISMTIWNNSKGLEYLIRSFLDYNKVTMNISVIADIKLFKDSTKLFRFNISTEFTNLTVGTSEISGATTRVGIGIPSISNLIKIIEAKELAPDQLAPVDDPYTNWMVHPIFVCLNVSNPVGINITIGNTTIYVLKDSKEVARVVINDTILIPAHGWAILNVTVYVFDRQITKEVIEEIITTQSANVSIDGIFDLEFLGVHLRNISISKLAFESIATQLTETEMNMQLWENFIGYSLGQVAILNATEVDGQTLISAETEIGNIPICIKLMHLSINVSTPYGFAVSLEILPPEGIPAIEIGPDLMSNVSISLTIFNSNKQAIEYLISNLLENGSVLINASVSAYFRLFNRSSDYMEFNLDFSLNNFLLEMAVSETGFAIPAFDTISNIVEIHEIGTASIDGYLAHVIFARVNVTNPFGINVTIGNLSIEIWKNGGKAIIIEIPDNYTLSASGSTVINATIYVIENTYTRALIEESITTQQLNVSIIGKLDASIFGITLKNLTIRMNISQDVSPSSTGSTSFALMPITDIISYNASSIEILSAQQFEDYSEIKVKTSAGDIPIHLTLYSAEVNITTPYGLAITVYILSEDGTPIELGPGLFDDINVTIKVWQVNRDAVDYLLNNLVNGKTVRVTLDIHAHFKLFNQSSSLMEFDLTFRVRGVELGGEATGISTEAIPLPVNNFDQFVKYEVIDVIQDEITYYIDDKYTAYRIITRLNITNTFGIDFSINKLSISLYEGETRGIILEIRGPYDLKYGEPTIIDVSIYVLDNPAAHNLIDAMLISRIVNATVKGNANITIFGVSISGISFTMNLSDQITRDVISTQIRQDAWMKFVNYTLGNIRILGENQAEGYTDIEVETIVGDIPITLILYDAEIDVYTPYGKGATLTFYPTDGSIELGPDKFDTIKILLRVWQSNNAAVEYLVKKSLQNEEVVVNVTASVSFRLFSTTTEYLHFNTTLTLHNLAYKIENVTDYGATVLPVNLTSLGEVTSIEYIGVNYINNIKAYQLRINVTFTNIINISFGFGNLNFDIYYKGAKVAHGEIPDWHDIPAGTKENMSLYIWIFDTTTAQQFLEDILVHYTFNATTTGFVNIEVFGVRVYSVNFSQVIRTDATEYISGDKYQKISLGMFDMTVKTIEILEETNDYALMRYNLTVSNSLITVFMRSAIAGEPAFYAYIYYDDPQHVAPVAYVEIQSLDIIKSEETKLSVTLKLFKFYNGIDVREKLEGFLNAFMVNKCATIDVKGEARLYLFELGNHLYFEIPFFFNNTTYSVENYEESLRSGEIDTSFLFDQILEIGNTTWKFIEETDDYVRFYIYQEVKSTINIGIVSMTSYGMLEPLNMTTAFLIERISDAYITAGQWTNLTMEITLLKGSNKTYLQQFLDATLHEWVIDIYVDTYMILELFGVTIGTPSHPLEAFGTKFTYIIDPDTIQSIVFGVTEQYASNVASESQELLPLGYGNWYSDDLYGGVELVVNNPKQYGLDQPWVWQSAGFVQGTGTDGWHYNDPSSPAWEEKRVFLIAGYTYHIRLDWDSDSDLDFFIYRPGEAPSEDGTGWDYYASAITTSKPEELDVTPDVTGWWIIGIDHYSGSGSTSFDLTVYKISPAPAYPDPSYVNVWNFKWILLEFKYSIQGGEPHATIRNFKALMFFTGEYINGSSAHGDIRDYIGEIYIPEFEYTPATTMFYAYLRLWRWNRFTGTNSSLKDYVYRMTLGQYNFSIRNATFDLELFGCYIRNISLAKLDFSGIYDPWSLSTKVEWKGLEKWSINIDWWNDWWVVDGLVHVASPSSPAWLLYTSGEMWADDDPVFNWANDPPEGTVEDGTWKMGPYWGPTADAQPYSSSTDIEILDAPTSLPNYAIFMGGGEARYWIRIDITVADINWQCLANMDVDSKYDDETQKEQDAASGVNYVIWWGTGYGEMWSTCTWKTVTETLMFWWIIHVPSPLVAITSGDWLQSAYLPYRPDPNNETQYRIYISNINGRPYVLTQYMDGFDGRFDISEPDNYGNT